MQRNWINKPYLYKHIQLIVLLIKFSAKGQNIIFIANLNKLIVLSTWMFITINYRNKLQQQNSAYIITDDTWQDTIKL